MLAQFLFKRQVRRNVRSEATRGMFTCPSCSRWPLACHRAATAPHLAHAAACGQARERANRVYQAGRWRSARRLQTRPRVTHTAYKDKLASNPIELPELSGSTPNLGWLVCSKGRAPQVYFGSAKCSPPPGERGNASPPRHNTSMDTALQGSSRRAEHDYIPSPAGVYLVGTGLSIHTQTTDWSPCLTAFTRASPMQHASSDLIPYTSTSQQVMVPADAMEPLSHGNVRREVPRTFGSPRPSDKINHKKGTHVEGPHRLRFAKDRQNSRPGSK